MIREIKNTLTIRVFFHRILILKINLLYYADMAELVDAQDLGSCNEGCGGSSPFIRTTKNII